MFSRRSTTFSGTNNNPNVFTDSSNLPIDLSIKIESPPCVMYGTYTDSTGALLSGLLTLTVKDPLKRQDNRDASALTAATDTRSNSVPYSLTSLSNLAANLSTGSLNIKSHSRTSFTTTSPSPSPLQSSSSSSTSPSTTLSSSRRRYNGVTVTSVTLKLVQKIHYHKPFVPPVPVIQNCPNCTTKVRVLKTWDIQRDTRSSSSSSSSVPVQLPIGSHTYPFSYLIPGTTPPSSSFGSEAKTEIKYELIAVATYRDPLSTISSMKTKLYTNTNIRTLQLPFPIQVKRCILRAQDRHSLRVFPPTELTATAVLPNVIFPKSSFPLELKLDGVASRDRRWRMHKLSWRIEETTRIRASSCPIHKANLRKLEAEVTKREIELSKKPIQPIKRYGDIGPRVRVSVASPESVTGGIGGGSFVASGSDNNNNNGNTLRPQSLSTNGNDPMSPLETNALSRPPGVAATSAATANTGMNASTSTNLLSHHRGVGGVRGEEGGEDGEEEEEGAAFGEEGEENPNVPFIHPSDDALRQEILQQQRRIREEQLRQEHKFNDSTLFTEEVRILCKSELKSGWKTNFDNNGSIELVTEIDCTALNSGFTNSETFSTTNKSVSSRGSYLGATNQPVTLACNMRDPNLGIYVSHILAVEMVVAEETLQYSDGRSVSDGSGSNSATVSPSDVERESRLAEVSPMFATRTPKIRTMFESATSSMGSSANRTTRGTSSSNSTANSGTNNTNDISGSNNENNNNCNVNGKGINSKASRQNTPNVIFAPTGAARVLRMQFKLNFTERSGLGVSWDDEVPPLYEEVKRVEAPPNYAEAVLPPSYVSICGQDETTAPESPLISPCPLPSSAS